MPYDFSKNIKILNLCDRSIYEITKYKNILINKDIALQIGSYSCENYFKYIMENIKIVENTKYDLVIPILSEHSLKISDTNEFINMCEHAQTVTVNDIGMLDKLNCRNLNIRLGRLFFKDYRDHRYSEYNNSCYSGKAHALLNFLLRQGFCINSVENDITTRNYVVDLPPRIKIYFHFPYRQISTARICEFSSIGKAVEYKFIPDDKCDMQCLYTGILSEEAGYIKLGKNIYDILDPSYLKDDNDIIYTPEWYYENNGPHCR